MTMQSLSRSALVWTLLLFLLIGGASNANTSSEDGDKLLSGMSIVGNDEAPKSLVIVPWKSSELGDTLAVSRALDDGKGPVDRDVFTRGLKYYEIQSHIAGQDQ
jgi:hypothetical protein